MRLLILSCSRRKLDRPAPALELYDGPLFRVVRKAMRDGVGPGDVAVYILSARYGLIPARRVIEPYDRRMTPARARELEPRVFRVLAYIAHGGRFDEVYIEVGQDYLPALPGEEVLWFFFGCPVRYGRGTIGKRARALKEWLYAGSK